MIIIHLDFPNWRVLRVLVFILTYSYSHNNTHIHRLTCSYLQTNSNNTQWRGKLLYYYYYWDVFYQICSTFVFLFVCIMSCYKEQTLIIHFPVRYLCKFLSKFCQTLHYQSVMQPKYMSGSITLEVNF